MSCFAGGMCYVIHPLGGSVAGVIVFSKGNALTIKVGDEISQYNYFVDSDIDIIVSIDKNIGIIKCKIKNIDIIQNVFEIITVSTELIESQRKCIRFNVNFYANIREPETEDTVIVAIKNIGKDGLLFTTNENFKMNQILEISFYKDNQKFTLNTQIIRKLQKNIFEYGTKILDFRNDEGENFHLYMELLNLNQEKLKNNLTKQNIK